MRPMMRPALLVMGLVAVTACSSSPAPADESLALGSCAEALAGRLATPGGDRAAETTMIGRREHGWLVRGLSTGSAAGPAQDDECRLDDATSGPPTLTHLRLCEAGAQPWGCPTRP